MQNQKEDLQALLWEGQRHVWKVALGLAMEREGPWRTQGCFMDF